MISVAEARQAWFVDEVLGGLRQRFTFAKLESGGGRFLERDVRQQDDFSIWIDQVDKIEKLQMIDIPEDRRRDKTAVLTDSARSILRAKACELWTRRFLHQILPDAYLSSR